MSYLFVFINDWHASIVAIGDNVRLLKSAVISFTINDSIAGLYGGNDLIQTLCIYCLTGYGIYGSFIGAIGIELDAVFIVACGLYIIDSGIVYIECLNGSVW